MLLGVELLHHGVDIVTDVLYICAACLYCTAFAVAQLCTAGEGVDAADSHLQTTQEALQPESVPRVYCAMLHMTSQHSESDALHQTFPAKNACHSWRRRSLLSRGHSMVKMARVQH